MKITMYELLGMVKDGKAPSKIKYDGIEWEYTGYQYQRLDKENLGNIWNGYNFNILNYEVEILEEEKKTIDDLNLSLQEIEAFQEARQIFLKLNNEEDKQTFIKLLLGEGTYER